MILSQRLFLSFWHVLEDRDAARVKSLSIRVLLEEPDKFTALLSHLFVEDKFLVEWRLRVTLWITLDVGDGHFDPNGRTN